MTQIAETDRVLIVQTDEVKPDPAQPRRDFDPEGEHAWLVESVKQHGIINPITVRPDNGNGYVVIAGERRLRAALEAGIASLTVLVRERPDDNSLVLALVENVVRTDLNPIEEGDAYMALRDQGTEPEEIARLVNRPVARIQDRLSLAGLPAPARAAVVAHEPLPALRTLAQLAELDRPLAEALAFGAECGVYGWPDLTNPAHCLSRFWRHNFGQKAVKCKACGGIGYRTPEGAKFASEEEYEEADAMGNADWCPDCQGEGEQLVEDKRAPKPPVFFAVPLSQYGNEGVQPAMLAQLPEEARTRVEAAQAKATEHYESVPEEKRYYVSRPPEPSLAGEKARAAAEGVQGIGILIDQRLVVTSPEFVAEYLPEIYEQEVEDYIAGSKRKPAAAKAKKPVGDMSPAERKKAEAEAEVRAKERAEQLALRQAARQFNGDLGVALANIGEVKVTTEAVKLLVGIIIGHDRRDDYNGRRGEGHALWQRYTALDWPTRKNGDPLIPRSTQDRRDYAVKVDEQTDKELARAKTPEQALAVLVRYLGHGFADLSGLPNADLEGAFPYGSARRSKPWLLKLLPAGVRKRVKDDNGIPGSSYAW